MSHKTVFLSWSRDNGRFAESFANELRHFDVGTSDLLQLAPGSLWVDQLNQQIQQTDALVTILSDRGKPSKWTLMEIGSAFGHNKPIYVISPPGVEVDQEIKGIIAADHFIVANDHDLQKAAGRVASSLSA